MRHLWIFLALPIVVVAACGEDNGQTPNCPELLLYDVRDAQTVAQKDAFKANVAAGCVTGPGTATTSTSAPTKDAGNAD